MGGASPEEDAEVMLDLTFGTTWGCAKRIGSETRTSTVTVIMA